MSRGWIGVDFDGTLATYFGWDGPDHIGDPIPKMVEKVKKILVSDKLDIRIFTARVHRSHSDDEVAQSVVLINNFCQEQFGRILPITCEKDKLCVEIWDDRARRVLTNQGVFAEDAPR